MIHKAKVINNGLQYIRNVIGQYKRIIQSIKDEIHFLTESGNPQRY